MIGALAANSPWVSITKSFGVGLLILSATLTIRAGTRFPIIIVNLLRISMTGIATQAWTLPSWSATLSPRYSQAQNCMNRPSLISKPRLEKSTLQIVNSGEDNQNILLTWKNYQVIREVNIHIPRATTLIKIKATCTQNHQLSIPRGCTPFMASQVRSNMLIAQKTRVSMAFYPLAEPVELVQLHSHIKLLLVNNLQ